MSHTFEPVKNTAFQRKLKEYMKESEGCPMIYRGKEHEEIFKSAVESSLDSDNAMLSALYLLTADKLLWSKVRHAVGSKSVDFSAIRLGNLSTDAYTLFMTARDLYEGEAFLRQRHCGRGNRAAEAVRYSLPRYGDSPLRDGCNSYF